uniref:Reverse transcriptase domain-containing protein n=1 Tax=Tanacetum cinerariifolium TaxID=118510 RepID=A0A699ITP3_TANCI|nr:hypothetical protein [Tanacetum cinerariifolium]GEZ83332.1 hypothetical protein [Tanacetum cinerariifolium]
MDIPLLLDHAFDFFAVEPVPGLAEAPDNQNGWIEWDVPLGGEMDKPMENPGFDEEEELNEVATQPQVIDDLCVRMSNLEYRHGELVKKMEIVNDAEAADSIAIKEIHPRVTTLEGQEKLCNAPMLALFDGPNDFVVYCDASKQGFGCLLMQRGKVIAYASSQLKTHEKNYTTHDLELDALSRKERLKPRRVRAMSITYHFGLKTKILEAQGKASKDLKAPAKWLRGLETHFELRNDGGIYFFDRIWIPSVGGVRKLIIDKAHTSRYLIHPGADKMYYDMRDLYMWPGMKRHIAEYVSRCLTDGYDAIWVIVDRLTKSAHFLPIREDYKTEKLARIYINEILARHEIKERLKMARSRQKSYADKRSKPLELKVGDRVLLKVSPWKGVELRCVHDTFHVSNLKKCLVEPYVQVTLDEIEIDENLHFVKEPMEIVERDVKNLKRKRIPLVKVRWNSRQRAEYTWERKD